MPTQRCPAVNRLSRGNWPDNGRFLGDPLVLRTKSYRQVRSINSELTTRRTLVEGLVVEQGEWIARRNIRNYSELIRESPENGLNRVLTGLLRDEKKKLYAQFALAPENIVPK